MLKIPRVSIFPIGMIGNEAEHLLECVNLYVRFINKNET